MRCRKSPVSALHNAFHSMLSKEIYHLFGTEIVEGWLKEIWLGMDITAEFIPRLGVSEVAAAFSGNHYFTARACHLFKNDDTPGIIESLCSSSCCHESGSATANHYYVC